MALPSAPAYPRIGRYELVAGIASGGMGAVVLARLAGAGGFQRLFAIKVLHKHFGQDAEFTEMLLDEARIAARIHHPNVVSIQEVAESREHGYYLVMDYVEGFPLSDMLPLLVGAATRDRARIVTRVVLDALLGLHAAHTLVDDHGMPLNVVHRDVSPQNILVSIDGVSRVTDFGIAKAAARISHTRAGAVKGKLAYMAPEQARGGVVDARSDLFAAGIVLWESLTGQRLFKGTNDPDTFARIMSARIPDIREVMPDAPEALAAFCARALERPLERRFASAREMAAALERAARPTDLVGDAPEVGEWITAKFADRLDERHAAIRRGAKDTVISAPMDVDAMSRAADAARLSLSPSNSRAAEVTVAPGRASREGQPTASGRTSGVNVASTPGDVRDEDWDALPTTAMDTAGASQQVRDAMAAYTASLVPPAPRASAAQTEPRRPSQPVWQPPQAPSSRPAQPADDPFGVAPTPAAHQGSLAPTPRPQSITALHPPTAPKRGAGRTIALVIIAVLVAAVAIVVGALVARWRSGHAVTATVSSSVRARA